MSSSCWYITPFPVVVVDDLITSVAGTADGAYNGRTDDQVGVVSFFELRRMVGLMSEQVLDKVSFWVRQTATLLPPAVASPNPQTLIGLPCCSTMWF